MRFAVAGGDVARLSPGLAVAASRLWGDDQCDGGRVLRLVEMRRQVRRGVVPLIVSLVGLAVPSSALGAFHIGVTAGVMTIADDPGETATFSVAFSPGPSAGFVPGAYNVSVEGGTNVVADPPCRPGALPTIGGCDGAAVTSITVNMNGARDVLYHTEIGVSGPLPVPMTVVGGIGDNSASVEAAAPVSMDLGPGDDNVHVSSSAPMSIAGGPGRDGITAMSTAPGADISVDGGDDIDQIAVLDPGSSATIMGGGGSDSIRAQGGPNTLNGGDGIDELTGNCCYRGDGQPYTPSPRLPDGDRDAFICGAGNDVLGTSRLQLEDSFAPDCPPYGAQTYAPGKITLNGDKSQARLAVRVPFKERFTKAVLYRFINARLRSATPLAEMRRRTTTVGGKATLVFDVTTAGRKALAGKTSVKLVIDGSATGIGTAAEPATLEVGPPLIALPFAIRTAKHA